MMINSKSISVFDNLELTKMFITVDDDGKITLRLKNKVNKQELSFSCDLDEFKHLLEVLNLEY